MMEKSTKDRGGECFISEKYLREINILREAEGLPQTILKTPLFMPN